MPIVTKLSMRTVILHTTATTLAIRNGDGVVTSIKGLPPQIMLTPRSLQYLRLCEYLIARRSDGVTVSIDEAMSMSSLVVMCSNSQIANPEEVMNKRRLCAHNRGTAAVAIDHNTSRRAEKGECLLLLLHEQGCNSTLLKPAANAAIDCKPQELAKKRWIAPPVNVEIHSQIVHTIHKQLPLLPSLALHLLFPLGLDLTVSNSLAKTRGTLTSANSWKKAKGNIQVNHMDGSVAIHSNEKERARKIDNVVTNK